MDLLTSKIQNIFKPLSFSVLLLFLAPISSFGSQYWQGNTYAAQENFPSFYQEDSLPQDAAPQSFLSQYTAPQNNAPSMLCSNCTHQNHGVNTIRPGFPNYERWSQMNATPWTWQVLPDGLIFSSYLAGPKESRLSAQLNYEKDHGWLWDAVAGGRIGLLRFGSRHGVLPEGFQLDAEGAALVRLDLEEEMDVMSADFRLGFPLTYGTKTTQYKFAYYHVSSHLGDEYMLRPNSRPRVNYVRDALVVAVAHRPHRDVRIYAEAAWAFFTGDETKPWEFQFGFEYSPIYPANSYYGSPFFAINGHLLQELDFGGNVNVQLGWQWRGPSNHLFRIGVQYFNGASDQFEFQDLHESKIGIGVWADF